MITDLSFCTAECDNLYCPRNKARIPPGDTSYHSWIAREDVPDCPFDRQKGWEHDSNKADPSGKR